MWSPNVTDCVTWDTHESGERQPPLLHWVNDMRRRAGVEAGWAQCFPVLGNDVLHSAFPLRASWLSEHIPTELSIKLSMQWPTTPSSQRTHVQHAHSLSCIHSLSLHSFGAFFYLLPGVLSSASLQNHMASNFSVAKSLSSLFQPTQTHTLGSNSILSINQYHQGREVQKSENTLKIWDSTSYLNLNNQKGIRVWKV